MFSIRTLFAVPLGSIVLCSVFLSTYAESSMYQKWIGEDVRWIISNREQSDFEALRTDEQRNLFVKAFWLRRDPTPDTPENEFKEEHYRRLAYANQHFAEGVAGWETDRGHTYIVYGPPDQIDTHSLRSMLDQVPSQKEFIKPVPYQVWHYRRAVGPSHARMFKFVDKCSCGKFELVETDQTP